MSSHVPACNKARTIVSVSQMNFHIFRVDHLPVEEAVGIGDSLILNIGELSMHLSVSLSLSRNISLIHDMRAPKNISSKYGDKHTHTQTFTPQYYIRRVMMHLLPTSSTWSRHKPKSVRGEPSCSGGNTQMIGTPPFKKRRKSPCENFGTSCLPHPSEVSWKLMVFGPNLQVSQAWLKQTVSSGKTWQLVLDAFRGRLAHHWKICGQTGNLTSKNTTTYCKCSKPTP